MTEPAVRRAGADAFIVDAARADELDAAWFDVDDWRRRGAALLDTGGRGDVHKLDRTGETWVLRHYRRGGLVSKLVHDRYVWLGLERTRAFREFRLLARLSAEGFPVPRPIAARVRRRGLAYRADIITRLLVGTRSLHAYLVESGPPAEAWTEIGRVVRGLHDRGVDHPDLTAQNLLLDGAGRVFVVDFDKTRLRRRGNWTQAGIDRLKRSLRKVALETGTEFDEAGWQALLRGYGGRTAAQRR